MTAFAECFWQQVDKAPGLGPEGDCWEWRGRIAKGYGDVVNPFCPPRRTGAHRLSYMLSVEFLCETELVCHSCDNPRCVNPNHLFAGSHKDNSADCVSKNRQSCGEQRSKFTRGLKNGRAKLSESDVAAILADSRPHRAIAKAFAISSSAVDHIKSGRTWAHLTRQKA